MVIAESELSTQILSDGSQLVTCQDNSITELTVDWQLILIVAEAIKTNVPAQALSWFTVRVSYILWFYLLFLDSKWWVFTGTESPGC